MKTLLITSAAISVLLVACGNQSTETHNSAQRSIAPPKVKLVGLTSILGEKRALLNVELPGSSHDSARQQQLILREYEKSGQLEVLEIDVKSARVRVNNSGLVTLLTLQDRSLPGAQ